MQEYERYHGLLELCFKAKERGIDCFFDYDANVESITIWIYKKGWKVCHDYDKKFNFYISDYWKDSKRLGPVVALEAISYINELLMEREDV